MNDDAKMNAAERAIELVVPGQVVGLGTGSTAAFAIQGLGRRVREGLQITGVPTSKAAEALARSLSIPLADLNEVARVDMIIDGADEVDPNFNMIKGGGGALTREKLVGLASEKGVYVVDESKLVDRLGSSFAVPVEVLQFGWAVSSKHLRELGCEPWLRGDGDAPFLTDNGNYILDCRFDSIADPAQLEKAIKQLPGVVESGLFIGIADVVIVGRSNGVEIRERAVQ